MLIGKRVAITGGTGSLGTRLLHRLLDATGPSTTFVIVSRDELKQCTQRERLPSPHAPRVRYVLADIRDRPALDRALAGRDLAERLEERLGPIIRGRVGLLADVPPPEVDDAVRVSRRVAPGSQDRQGAGRRARRLAVP